MSKTVPIKKVNSNDEIIPNYDFIFNDDESLNKTRKKSKNRFILKLAKANIKLLIISTLIYLIQAAPEYLSPIFSSYLVDEVSLAINNGVGLSPEVLKTILISFGIILILILSNVPTTIARWKVVSKMLRNMSAGVKCSVVRKLQSLSITYSKDMQTGKIQSKFLKDTETMDGFLRVISFSIIPAIINLIVYTVIALRKSPLIALFFLFIVPVNVFVTRSFRKRIGSAYRGHRIAYETMSTRLTTMLEMYAVTKAHGLEEKEIDMISKSIKDVRGSGISVDKISARFGAWMFVVSSSLSALCLVVCCFLAIKGMISIGDILLYQTMFKSISGSVSAIVNTMPEISSGKEAMASISEIMNAKDIEVNIGKKVIPEIEGNIDFKNVNYRYPNTNQDVVKGLNLSVKKGECVAFVGASGSGKSTVMNLITGLLLPTDGDILIDGKSIKEFNLSEYRHHLSVVPQNSILFSGTIRENITYGLEKYTEEEFQKAVELANVNEFIKDLPDGLETVIGERGDKLSGGQKQRITIARALIRNPKILILDEATSALDNISEYHVQKAISKSIAGRTTFIVAHRLSTIRDATRIVVMENGVAVEIGTYEELMEKKGKFYQLKCLNELNLKEAEKGLNV